MSADLAQLAALGLPYVVRWTGSHSEGDWWIAGAFLLHADAQAFCDQANSYGNKKAFRVECAS